MQTTTPHVFARRARRLIREIMVAIGVTVAAGIALLVSVSAQRSEPSVQPVIANGHHTG